MNFYTLKRDVLRATGILEYQWEKIKPGLYVFNYHRIGNPDETPFDPNLFSCDEAHFAHQIDLIKSRFRIINACELVQIISEGEALTQPLAMITFDDGYRDNFEKAFPILRTAKVPGLFFLPTSYISSDRIPWWDEVAWLIRNTKKELVQLPGWEQPIVIDRQNIRITIRDVLKKFKSDMDVPLVEKLTRVRAACDVDMPSTERSSLFMSWDQAREMQQGGMDIGSHAHSHEILSHLSVDEQRKELSTSKAILEDHINAPVETLAYPVGGRNSYTQDTCRLAKESGFKAAFTFVNGFNPNPGLSPFELLRIPVEDNSEPHDLKYSAAFARAE